MCQFLAQLGDKGIINQLMIISGDSGILEIDACYRDQLTRILLTVAFNDRVNFHIFDDIIHESGAFSAPIWVRPLSSPIHCFFFPRHEVLWDGSACGQLSV
ncbi:hypothetical protein ACJX0J_006482 [Zea mays]